jgi:hypothetical protein
MRAMNCTSPRVGPIIAVYVIYSADAIGPAPEIDRMGPVRHLPAGFADGRKRVGGIVASRFRQTAGDDAYDFGWLARKHRDDRYLPAADAPDEYDGDGYQGHHRTWTAELNYAEWLVFADRYHIDLDDDGLPVNSGDMLGSLTGYGLLPAVAVDNREGWESPGDFSVIDSSFFVSFAVPDPQLASPPPAPEIPHEEASWRRPPPTVCSAR